MVSSVGKPPRGRPPSLDYKIIIPELIKNCRKIVTHEGKIMFESANIWKEIANSLAPRVIIKATALHTLVVNNREKVQGELEKALGFKIQRKRPRSPANSTVTDPDSTWEDSVIGDELTVFSFSLQREEFLDLIVESNKKRNIRGKVTSVRGWKFIPYKWENPINEKIWYASKRKCGYNYKDSYVAATSTSGTIKGGCACGSKIDGQFKQVGNEMVFSCTATPGNGNCRKIFLRQPLRLKAGEKVYQGTTDTYRAELADKYITPGDPDCPLIPKASVLRRAKATYVHRNYWDEDPIIALSLMQATVYAEDIHFLSIGPFVIYYWTNFQRQAYNRYAISGKPCVFIDATGGIYPKFTKINGVKTHNSFLYIIVVNVKGEQFSIGQMASEAHDTVTIINFWNTWTASGFIKPREVVMDSGQALLTATIIALTGYPTIQAYADALKTDADISCYIRLDIAHFMAMYSRVLKDLPTLIKRFWMGCLGRLVFIRDIQEMREYLERIFIVGLFTKSGVTQNATEPCLAQKNINYLRDDITDPCVVNIVNRTLENEEIDTNIKQSTTESKEMYGEDRNDFILGSTFDDQSTNSWVTWGQQILKKLESKMREKNDAKTKKEKEAKLLNQDNGIDPNAYHCPHFIHRLVKDIKTIPLWSAVAYEKFNYGRIPASSASVECEFKKIKHNLYKKSGKERVDLAVERHIKYLQGKMKLVNIAVDEILSNHEFSAEFHNESPSEGKDNESTQSESPHHKSDHQERRGLSRDHTENDQRREEANCEIHETSREEDDTPKEIESDDSEEDKNSSNEKSYEKCDSPGKRRWRTQKRHTGKILGNRRDQRETNREPLVEISGNFPSCSKNNESAGEPFPVANSTLLSDFNESTDNDLSNHRPDCVACFRGDYPGGAHYCKYCGKAVHPFQKCSYPIDGEEEGYNEPRICSTCYGLPRTDLEEYLAKNYVENWKNQGKDKTSKPIKVQTLQKENLPKKAVGMQNDESLTDKTKQKKNVKRKNQVVSNRTVYLANPHKLKEILIYEKSSGLPILRSGQSFGLQPIRIKDREISLINTCPFDSIFQILLSGACDYPAVYANMKNEPHNELSKLVLDSLKRPLSAYSYKRRAEILISYFGVSNRMNGIEIIDCQSDVGGLAKKMFSSLPSWIERAKCNHGCIERATYFPTISLNAEALSDENFHHVFETWVFPQHDKKCHNERCSGREVVTENMIGDLVIFEPYLLSGQCVLRKLKDLPTEFNHPIHKDIIKLIGIIHFNSPSVRSRQDTKAIGHYIARCRRRDDKWMEYDDTAKKEAKAKRTSINNVALMFYAKI